VSTIFKALGLLFAAYVLVHWLTAGQDEIIKGPPLDPAVSTVVHPSSK